MTKITDDRPTKAQLERALDEACLLLVEREELCPFDKLRLYDVLSRDCGSCEPKLSRSAVCWRDYLLKKAADE